MGHKAWKCRWQLIRTGRNYFNFSAFVGLDWWVLVLTISNERSWGFQKTVVGRLTLFISALLCKHRQGLVHIGACLFWTLQERCSQAPSWRGESSGGPWRCLAVGAHKPGKWGTCSFSPEERRLWVWGELTADCHYWRGIVIEVLDHSQGRTATGQEAASTGCNKSNSCWVEGLVLVVPVWCNFHCCRFWEFEWKRCWTIRSRFELSPALTRGWTRDPFPVGLFCDRMIACSVCIVHCTHYSYVCFSLWLQTFSKGE